jgi:hypothetical protein
LELSVIIGPHYNVEEPAIVDLNAEGFNEGDKIIITFTAEIFYTGTYYPSNGTDYPINPESSGPFKDEKNLWWDGLLGIFSKTRTLLDIKQDNRVPDSVDPGTTGFWTPPTKWTDNLQSISDKLATKGISWYTGSEETNIQNDFKIDKPYTGFELVIPRNAEFLFLCCIDDLYYDNLGVIKVTIEKDSDGDGIPDHWEINGIDIDNDGIVDLDLPMLDADWLHKDLFVEIDYMPTLRPNQFALDLVIEAFDKSPVTNPDGANGINLHVIVNEEIPYKEILSDFNEFYSIKDTYFGDQNERLETKTIEAKKLIFRYCLSVDKIWPHPPNHDCPGVAEGKGCDDFIVAYGAFSSNTIENQAAVFMHELGHCLGLSHGGGDEVNYKPNYLSIMNYRFQFASLLPERPLDYSRKELPPIDETNVNEAVGIGEATKTVWYATFKTPRKYYVSNGNMPIDWNLDGNITRGLTLDLNYDSEMLGEIPSTHETLIGHDDWDNLIFRFRGTPLFRRSATPDDYHTELTDDEIEQQLVNAENVILVSPPDSDSEVTSSSFGVRTGDWLEYTVDYSKIPSEYHTVRKRIEVIGVDENSVTTLYERELANGNTETRTEVFTLEEGGEDFLIIPADLEVGDVIPNAEHGSISIDGFEKYSYAGEERIVLWAIEEFGTFHWDKETGIQVQADSESNGIIRKMVIEKTNIWGSSDQIGLDTTLVLTLIIPILLIIILIMIIRRKMKNDKNK